MKEYVDLYIELIKQAIVNQAKYTDKSQYENHHIRPRSIGGHGDKLNLIKLTHEEHLGPTDYYL